MIPKAEQKKGATLSGLVAEGKDFGGGGEGGGEGRDEGEVEEGGGEGEEMKEK
jgi:hypothetical protein